MRLRRAFLVALPLVVLTITLAVAAQGPDEVPIGQLRAAVAAQARATPGLMLTPGVVGTGIGVNSSNRGVLEIYVEDASMRFPRRIEGVPARVVVTGPIFAIKGPPGGDGPPGGGGGGGGGGIDPTAQFRPMVIGVSTGHPDITAGTIGASVRIAGFGDSSFGLSNNHVWANENQALPNDELLQPGSFDGGSASKDVAGSLYDSVPIRFDGGGVNCDLNRVDAAVMAVDEEVVLNNHTPTDGYGTPASGTVLASVRQRVMKYGRTTGQTKGRVQAVSVIVNVGYDSGVACFSGQIAIGGGGFSAGGDSGSLIVDAQNSRPVALLFAGGSGYTFANPIDEVLGAFSATIDGS